MQARARPLNALTTIASIVILLTAIALAQFGFGSLDGSSQTDANDARSLGTLGRLGMTPIEVRLPECPAVPTIAVLYAESNATLRDPTRACSVRDDICHR